jgi:hypothetical protein
MKHTDDEMLPPHPQPIQYVQATLQDSLSRVGQIATILWDINTAVGEALTPFETLLASPAILCKTANFARFRAKGIRIRFEVDGTPFHYGKLIASWLPLYDYDDVSADADTMNTEAGVCEATQKLHCTIDPCSDATQILEIPWIYPRVWYDLTSVEYAMGLGILRITDFNPLLHANSGTSGVNVIVYAQFIDPEVMLPTEHYTSVSKKMPVAVFNGGVDDSPGHLLGPPGAYTPGRNDADIPMSEFTSREAFLATFSWAPSETSGTILASWPVSPGKYLQNDTLDCHFSPLSFASLPFAFWRGSISYRFQVVAAAHHKGRLRIFWDTKEHDDSIILRGQKLSLEIDLAGPRDVVFTVPYESTYPFLRVANSVFSHTSGSVDVPTVAFDNGVISLAVQNRLVSPGSTTGSIYVNVYVCSKDMEFQVPVPDTIRDFSPYTSVSEVRPEIAATVSLSTDQPADEPYMPIVSPPPTMSSYLFGGPAPSLYDLARRPAYVETIIWNDAISDSNTIGCMKATIPVWPPYPGYNAYGWDADATDELPLTMAALTPFTMLRLCYLTWRGGLKSRYFMGRTGATVTHFSVDAGNPNNAFGTSVSAFSYDSSTDLANKILAYSLLPSKINPVSYGPTGASNISLDIFHDVTYPYTSPALFQLARHSYGPAKDTYWSDQRPEISGILPTTLTLIASTNSTTAKYISVNREFYPADDFQLCHFVSTPVLYPYTPPDGP